MPDLDQAIDAAVRAAEHRGEDPMRFEAKLLDRLGYPATARLVRRARRERDWPWLRAVGRLRS